MGLLPEKFAVEISETFEHPEWDEFLAGCGFRGHHEQTSRWAAVMRPAGWRAVRIVLRREGKIIGGAQILIQSKRFLGSIVYVRWGPCFADDDPLARRIWVDKLHAWAKALRAAFVVINPNCAHDDALVSFLRHKGYRPKKENLPPWNLTYATLLVDLSKPLDVIFSEMRTEWRRHIRRGIKSGLGFRTGGEKDLPAFFELMKCTAKRRGEAPNPSSLLFFQHLWQAFHPRDWIRLLLIEKAHQLVSAAVIFPFGTTVRFWKYGWSGEYQELRPNHFLYWQLIKYAKDGGHKSLDIVQVEPDIAKLIRKKQPLTTQQKKHPLFGPTYFKMGIGGKVFHYPGAYYRFYNPLLGLLFEFVVHPAMKIPWTKRALHRIS